MRRKAEVVLEATVRGAVWGEPARPLAKAAWGVGLRLVWT